MSTSIVSVPVNKSSLFVHFNRARARSAGLDRQRVNRALGYIQAGRVALLDNGAAVVSGASEPVYYVTGEGCECADHVFRGVACKHIISRWLLLRMEQEPSTPASVEEPGLEEDIAVLWGA